MIAIKFIWHLLWPLKWYLMGMICAMLGVALHTNLQAYFLKLIIDTIAGAASYNLSLIVLGFITLQGVLVLIWAFYDTCVPKINSIRNIIINRMVEKIYLYDAIFFQSNLLGNLNSKIKDAARLIPSNLLLIIENYMFQIFSILIACYLLSTIHIFFTVLLIGFIILFLFVFSLFLSRANYLSTLTAESDAKIWGHLGDIFSNIFSLKCFASQSFERTTFLPLQKDYDNNLTNQTLFMRRVIVILGTFYTSYIILCLILLLFLHKQNLITAGDFSYVLAINYHVVDHLFYATHSLRDFITHWGAIHKALKLLTYPVVVSDKPQAVALNVRAGTIIFEDVKFHYKTGRPLFDHLNVTIQSGQKVGVVGYSGSGKTTFANLILRLYDVTQGDIKIDHQSIKDVTQDSLRRSIGFISQDPTLFNRSIKDNIRYGDFSACDEDIIRAAEQSYAHSFILKLPEQYDTIVGEKGVKLSGGQRQRIAIARAFLKNAPILILDEATSQLDSLTENHIQDSLLSLMHNKTTLVIAHRLSTLMHMDRILVFNKGMIVEDGTHTELLALNGLYKELWNAQVGGFLYGVVDS